MSSRRCCATRLTRKAAEQATVDAVVAEYAVVRASIRRSQIAAISDWEDPDRAEIARREELSAIAREATGRYEDWQAANPIIPDLVARRRLEASTCARLLQAFDPDARAELSPGTRLLLQWADESGD